jgi:2-polyprenyl-3-methyl-5-hydroxy-6-metoxy-1,4-benzoquinol methylase
MNTVEPDSTSRRISTADAIAQLLSDSAGRDALHDSYLINSVEVEAEAFAVSAEFAETLRLIVGPLAVLTIADVGTGSGITSYAFARSGAKFVHAIEPDRDERLRQGAMRRLGYTDRIGIISTPGERLALSDAAVDVVYCRQVLHHASDLNLFLRECARILKPGGTLCACREHVVSDARELEMFLDAHPVHQLAGGENAYSVGRYLEALREAGLIVRRVVQTYDRVICAYPEVIPPSPDATAKRISYH